MGTRNATMNIKNDVIFGRVYKISNIVDEKVYIGGTTKSLIKSLSDHMYYYSIGISTDLYKHFSKIGVEYFNMELLEWKQIDNLEELHVLEQKWIDRENQNNVIS